MLMEYDKSGSRHGGHMLIIRFSLMGDVAMSLHSIMALRKQYPSLRITIATKKKFAKFYETVPDSQVITLGDPGNFKSLLQLIKTLKSMDIDYVADIHNTIRGKLIRNSLRFKGAKVAVLDKERKLRRRLKRMKGTDIIPIRHNVLRFCDVFARLGFPVADPVVSRKILPVPEGFAGELEASGHDTSGWIGFAPFASKEIKIYPEEKRSELIRMLSEKFERVFIFGGPGKEKDYAMKMEEMYKNVTSVFGKTDIQGEIALISNLSALITMDSGAMHMASLVGTRTISVWGATHPAAGFFGYGEDASKDFVQVELPCRPCSIYGEGECTRGDFKCMNDIKPEDIIKRI